ncbi:hypothetical protein GMOD_00002614 [Pyrenophora seminiperda CCB06]|uniref:Uncharacterized protein n=1 Tax=Pyrenophora seminiperda CCB06 TaxID=1302712 RepID=A0A3M7M2S9_9PLEO|nr:hypothetical protein GMOD_00002614 [Pyrenophora seminiperda CCB06]
MQARRLSTFTVSIRRIDVYADQLEACRIARGDEAGALLTTSVRCAFPSSCDDRRFKISDVLAGKSRIVTPPTSHTSTLSHCPPASVASFNQCLQVLKHEPVVGYFNIPIAATRHQFHCGKYA